MRVKLIVKLMSLMLVLSVVTSCGDDEVDPTTSGSMSWKVDGVSQSAVLFNNTLIKAIDPGTGIGAKRLDIRGSLSDGTGVIVTISDFRDRIVGNCITEETYDLDVDNNYCEDIDAVTEVCNGYIGTYFYTSTQAEIASIDDVGTVTITSCDESNKMISGVFSFSISDFFTGEILYDITDGVFTDVSYTVIE